MSGREPVGLAAIRAWPLEQYPAGAAAADATAHRLLTAAARSQSVFDADPAWVGVTRATAGAAVGVTATRIHRLAQALTEVSAAVHAAAAELAPVRERLLELVDTGRGEGFGVDDAGWVTAPAPDRRADADYLSARIRSLLRRAVALDRELGRRLDGLSGLLAGDGRRVARPGGGWDTADAVLTRLPALTPADRRSFFLSLSPGEVAALRAADPGLIGNLDGVPFPVRIEANAVNVRRALAAEVAAGRGDGDRARDLRGLLGARLIAFDPAGNGRYIEQIGELTGPVPGVGVLVPGTGAGPHTAAANARRARALADRSGAPVFVYADGDFPQQVAPPPGPGAAARLPGSAIDPRPARAIGRDLAGFGAALDLEVAGTVPGAPVAYIGHSYGGTIVGTAEQYGLRADAVVFASGSGTGAADGPWHDPNPAVRRYSMTPPGDPIHWAQRFGGLHGADPDTAPGVTRLDTGHYGQGNGHHGELVAGVGAHGGYLDDPDSTAFGNLVAVLSGDRPAGYVPRGEDLPGGEAVGTAREVLGEPGRRVMGRLLVTALRESRLPPTPGG